ncbi:hypothetical protein N7507_001980 [Penicillium longicatenatum]|nr:hypothetical protein N7507_001980 [Penicillium longicatenatum]
MPAEHDCFSDDGSASPATAVSSGHRSYTYDDMELYDDESWGRLEWDAFERQWGLYTSKQPGA